MMSARTLLLSLTLVASGPLGCARVFEYPEPDPEADVAACADGEDNDLDGSTDCADPDCLGLCPEESETECSDRADNDGDGVVDAADPRCWPLLPPQARRCAETPGVEVVDNFDFVRRETITQAWLPYGVVGAGPELAFRAPPHERVVREGSGTMTFAGSTAPSGELPGNLGALARMRPFAGSWHAFALSFAAELTTGSILGASIVPLEFAANLEAPSAGADAALIAVRIDRTRPEGVLELVVDGQRHSTLLPLSACASGDSSDCAAVPLQVSVVLEAETLIATATDDAGTSIQIRAPAPEQPGLRPSRLVFSGGSTGPLRFAELDAVRLHVDPEWPCGFSVPQIPARACDEALTAKALGHGVSVAGRPDGAYCALVTTSPDLASPPSALSVWQSTDGKNWAPSEASGSASLALDGVLVGAGIAADQESLHVAAAEKGPDSVTLRFFDGASCGDFADTGLSLGLFADAEAPSYVIVDGKHWVYFTRPANDQVGRTLWRLARGIESELELVAELPDDVGAPVSVTLAGQRDLVLAYPLAASTGRSGAGLLVAGDDAATWQPIATNPLLELATPLTSQEGRVAFDDRGLLAASLAWGAQGGFLVYSGLSITGFEEDGYESVLSVGQASFMPSGSGDENAAIVPNLCGNGACDAGELCTSCEIDCPCDGPLLLTGAFDSEDLDWVGGASNWSFLSLARPLTGDFELSFDACSAATDAKGFLEGCSLYVGLARRPSASESSADQGIYVKLELEDFCPDRYAVTPVVQSRQGSFLAPEPDPTPCPSSRTVRPDAWQRVVLRRRGGAIGVVLPTSDGCGPSEQTLLYAGAVSELDSLAIGFGGPGFESCPEGSGAGTLANIELRLLADPVDCPAGSTLCAGADEEPSCVDVATSSEHCGGCGRSCAASESCKDGRCRCSQASGILECDGQCTDSRTSDSHCGSCDQTCAERCVAGRCDLFGTCAEPFNVPAEGGTFTFIPLRNGDATHAGFSYDETVDVEVSGPVYGLSVLTWIPSISGEALIEASVDGTSLDTTLLVSSLLDARCTGWDSCSEDAGGALGLGSRIVLPVNAGSHYRIGVGARPVDTAAFGQAAVLRIGINP
jgi:hypothetical protein